MQRSVAKMLRMETEPERLVDPTFLPMREAGRDGTYYLNLSTMDLQRHPGWYDLPRGGILLVSQPRRMVSSHLLQV